MSTDWLATLRGTLWMVGAVLSFCAMAVAVRELSGALHTFQILAIRNGVGLAVISSLLTRRGWHHARPRQLPLHALRGAAHLFGQFAWFYAIGVIPLSAVFAIELSTPLWTAVLALLLLGETVTAGRIIAIGAGLSGVLLILRPGWEAIHPASLLMLAGAVAYGLTHTATKKLSASNSALSILFYMLLIQTLLVLGPAIEFWEPVKLAQGPWLLVIAFAGLTAHYCLIRALLLADATVVIPIDFLRLPLIAMVGLALYGEPVDLWLMAGSALILVGLLVNLITDKYRRGNSPQAQPKISETISPSN